MQLDNDFIEKQKKTLLDEKTRVENDIKKLKKYPDYGFDEEDNLQELTDYESNLIIDSQVEYLLEKINNALKSIEKGTYGQCVKCKKFIEEGRLDLMPWADACVECSQDKSK